MEIIETLPFIYVAACIGVIGFQFALMAGAPWGHLTQGGQHQGALPTRNRVAAFISVFIVASMAMAVTSAAGFWPRWPVWTAWVTVALQFIIALVNWITPSKPERRLWGPIESAMFVTAALVVFRA